jgi:hypothetical protein
MAKMTIVRTKSDNKSWLVGLDGEIISEIDNEAIADQAAEADVSIAVEVRAHAASHAWFTT